MSRRLGHHCNFYLAEPAREQVKNNSPAIGLKNSRHQIKKVAPKLNSPSPNLATKIPESDSARLRAL